MKFTADLHIHSHYSRATSKDLKFEQLYKWAQIKGIKVVATGDVTHPGWLKEIKTKLEPTEEGLFKLKDIEAKSIQKEIPKACAGEVRFILSGEISNIYKKNDQVRKNHNVVFFPSIEVVEKFQNTLEKIGNIRSDGRPILGLDAKNLLELILESHKLSYLIPAHIWTPWFSVLGSKSGFDSIKECFEELTEYIFAVETGLSSDPPMNWRLSQLDRFTLISNSDAHSPAKLAREGNLFDCELNFSAIREAMKSADRTKFLGTIEFFPEEGKYHLDGHRKCNTRMTPADTFANNGICPVCGKSVTVGVLNRVEKLANRPKGSKHDKAKPYLCLIPLPEILAEILNVAPGTKKVQQKFEKLLTKLGSEISILSDLPLEEIEKADSHLLAEGIRRMRQGEVKIDAGYDGEFGTIKLFSAQERKELGAQTLIFQNEVFPVLEEQTAVEQISLVRDKLQNYESKAEKNTAQAQPVNLFEEIEDESGLNARQAEAVRYEGNFLLIVAGPGTGKTRTLTYRLAHLLQTCHVSPVHILAVTFTNRAADEMRERLIQLVGKDLTEQTTIKTFHALGAMILRNEAKTLGFEPAFSIYTEDDKSQVLKKIAPTLSVKERNKLAEKISQAKNQLLKAEAEAKLIKQSEENNFQNFYGLYQQALKERQAFDFDDLIFQSIKLLNENAEIKQKYQEKFLYISVDEYQDINFAQYFLLRQLTFDKTSLCVIGDPDQAIYGFRGSDRRYFLQFEQDFPAAKVIHLEKNYRSVSSILKASTQVIAKNEDHQPTNLWSNLVSKTRIDIFQTPTEKSEAETIVHQIERMVGATSFFSVDSGRAGEDETENYSGFADIAILYRVNAQLQALEEAFIRSGIPYQTFGEVPFYQKPEVREVISYLKVCQNPHSDIDLLNIINVPPRRISDQTLHIITSYQQRNEITLWSALERCSNIVLLSETQKQPILHFVAKIKEVRNSLNSLSVAELIELILKNFGLHSYYKNDKQRLYFWDQLKKQEAIFAGSLSEYLERIVLQKEPDVYEPHAEKVTLMTLHAAKGLEFSVVFIAGCEEDLIPYRRKNEAIENLEEERRLFYVGMTRAKHRLLLLRADSRFLFGERKSNRLSRFLNDIEQALKENREAQLKEKKLRDQTDKTDRSQMSLF